MIDFSPKELRRLGLQWDDLAEEIEAYARDFRNHISSHVSQELAANLEQAAENLEDAAYNVRALARIEAD